MYEGLRDVEAGKFPDIVALMPSALAPSTLSAVVDCEVVTLLALLVQKYKSTNTDSRGGRWLLFFVFLLVQKYKSTNTDSRGGRWLLSTARASAFCRFRCSRNGRARTLPLIRSLSVCVCVRLRLRRHLPPPLSHIVCLYIYVIYMIYDMCIMICVLYV